MPFDLNSFKKAGTSIEGHLKSEYASIRTGRATPTILDNVQIEAYGSKMPVNQLATVSVEDSKTLRIVPWDKEVAKAIDQGIRESNLGLSVSLDSTGLRVSFPELTSDRRAMLSKLAKEKLEEARIAVRNEREKVLSALDKDEKEGRINEDDKFRYRGELQKLVDETNDRLAVIFTSKEKEILE